MPVRSENYKIKCKHFEELLIINVHLKKCNLLLHVMKSTIFTLISSPEVVFGRLFNEIGHKKNHDKIVVLFYTVIFGLIHP